ncbi:MAG: glycosyl hydrolase [Ginsengibacter sp.]
MKKKYFIVVGILILGCSIGSAQNIKSGNRKQDIQHLTNEFVNPPMSSRPGAYWCWLNGDVTNASITHDLEAMKDKGMGSADIWDVAAINNPNGLYGTGPQFLGDESVKSIKHALSEGKRLGLKIGMVASSGWNAGGSWVEPYWAAKALYSSELKVEGPRLFSGALPFPTLPKECPKDKNGFPIYSKEIAVLAIRDNPEKTIRSLQDVIVLNKEFDGKTLKWKVPAGKWTLLRFVCSNTGQHLIVPSPKSNGLFIDYLNPNATTKYLTYILDRLGITKANADTAGLSYLSFDSMELDEATAWTDMMDSIFFAHHGYNILPYLPAFAGWKLPGGNDHFLQQFRKTVSDQLILSHYTTGRDFLSGYGIELVAEAGGPGPPLWNTCPVDAITALGNVSIPRGEFWIRNRYNLFLVKEIASASHIYGLNLVDGESFTTWRRWKDAPHDLKKYVDRAFCEGLNKITFHAFANTRPEFGLPGRAYHAGSDINPTTTWWKESKPFMDYLSRCSYMLRQGKFAADVAYYYGDKAPNFFPELQGSPNRPGLDGLSFGYDFDIINTEILLNKMTVSNDKLVLPDGLSYRLLVIPNLKDIPVKAMDRVKKMIASGAKVLFLNSENMPKDLNSYQLKDISIDAALNKLAVAKDFTGDEEKLDFIHRKSDTWDVYFVRNKTDKTLEEDCLFRAIGKQVELWDPVTERIYEMKNGIINNGLTKLKLQLAPYASCFIVFNSNKRVLPEYSFETISQRVEMKDPWKVSFPKNWGAPESIELNKLISWTDYPNDGVKYFSGTASYTNSFEISATSLAKDSIININLGDVFDVAKVVINGKPVGVLWTKPYKLNIKDYLKPGKNFLEIQITNMWINRLTGDMMAVDGKKYCQTNIPYITKDRAPGGDEKFHVQDAGLIGPVFLESIRYSPRK